MHRKAAEEPILIGLVKALSMRDTLVILAFLGLAAGGWYILNRETASETRNPTPTEIFSPKSELTRSAQVAPRSDAEAESLPTIYSRKEQKERVKSSALASKKLKKQRKNLHGVPVDLFVVDQQNRLRLTDVPEEADNGLRVFVQCTEIKKHSTEAIPPQKCRPLAVMQGVAPQTY